MRKTLLWIIRGQNLLSFSCKKIVFFETFSGHFHGQSFIKTVRGPLRIERMIVVVVFVFNVPPTAKVIRRRGHGLKSHPTDW